MLRVATAKLRELKRLRTQGSDNKLESDDLFL